MVSGFDFPIFSHPVSFTFSVADRPAARTLAIGPMPGLGPSQRCSGGSSFSKTWRFPGTTREKCRDFSGDLWVSHEDNG
jgi:hypothetical protein